MAVERCALRAARPSMPQACRMSSRKQAARQVRSVDGQKTLTGGENRHAEKGFLPARRNDGSRRVVRIRIRKLEFGVLCDSDSHRMVRFSKFVLIDVA